MQTQSEKRIQKILRQISLKYCIPYKDVEDVFNSQFMFVKEVMESADKTNPESFKSVRLPKFGLFLVKKGRLKYYKTKSDDTECSQ